MKIWIVRWKEKLKWLRDSMNPRSWREQSSQRRLEELPSKVEADKLVTRLRSTGQYPTVTWKWKE